MNMKAMLGAFLALLIAVGGTAFLVARVVTPKTESTNPADQVPVDGQYKANPFDLIAPSAKPKAVVDELHYNFGSMALGGEQSHDFVFKNEGDGPLRLAKGPLMCKCTMPAVPEQEIKPGESISIKLTWKPVETSPDFSKDAVIWTNDPMNPKVILSVSGIVFQDPDTNPRQYTLGDISWNKDTESVVHFGSGIASDMKIESYEVSDPDWMKVTWESEDVANFQTEKGGEEPAIKPLSSFSIKLKISPNGKVGPFSSWVKLKGQTNVPFERTIYVYGNRAGPILIHGPDYQAAMSMIDLKRFKSAEGRKTRMFLFLVPFGEDLKITEVISKSKNLAVTLAKESASGKDKDRYVMTVEAKPGAEAGTTFSTQSPDELTIKTNHPEVPEILFKARYIVQ